MEIVPASPSAEDCFLREVAQSVPAVRGLPDDLASNLDYYLHGHARKQQPRRGRWISGVQPAVELSEPQISDDLNKLLSLAAETHHLPADLSTNHDHYLHGLPKR